jgi:hypothetical protein
MFNSGVRAINFNLVWTYQYFYIQYIINNIMIKKSIYIFLIVTVILIVGCSQEEISPQPSLPSTEDSILEKPSASNKRIEPLEQDEIPKDDSIPNKLYCERHSDCVDSVEAFPQCNHYCIDDECDSIGKELCSVISKLSEEYSRRENLNCVWSAPCTKPSIMECKNNICVAS